MQGQLTFEVGRAGQRNRAGGQKRGSLITSWSGMTPGLGPMSYPVTFIPGLRSYPDYLVVRVSMRRPSQNYMTSYPVRYTDRHLSKTLHRPSGISGGLPSAKKLPLQRIGFRKRKLRRRLQVAEAGRKRVEEGACIQNIPWALG